MIGGFGKFELLQVGFSLLKIGYGLIAVFQYLLFCHQLTGVKRRGGETGKR